MELDIVKLGNLVKIHVIALVNVTTCTPLGTQNQCISINLMQVVQCFLQNP